MELMFVIAVAAYVVTNVASDASYAVRGKTSPRLLARLEKQRRKSAIATEKINQRLARQERLTAKERRRAQKARQKASRYGLRRYCGDLWQDSWRLARVKTAKKFGSDNVPSAAAPTSPAIKGPGTGDVPTIPETEPAPATPATATTDAAPGEPAPTSDTEPDHGGFRRVEGGDYVRPDREAEHEHRERIRRFLSERTDTTEGGTETSAPSDQNSEPAVPLAAVLPIRTQQKGDQMNTANSETTTLTAAKAYTVAMADAAQQAAASVEQTQAHLAANQVGGDALARLAEAQDLAAQLQAKFKAAYDELAKQDAVKDAYNAVPDAGSKEFVTNE